MARPTIGELQERLATLARKAPPKARHPAAMCYRMAAPPTTADYVCPVDGERTQYARGAAVQFVLDVPAMRQAVKALPGIEASLDESSLCRKCTPKATRPTVALIFKHPDGRAVRTEDVGTFDLQILHEFLEGTLEHEDRFGATSPLKEHLPRLRTLLGLEG